MSNFLHIVQPDEESHIEKARSVPEHSGQFRFNFEDGAQRRIVLIPMDDIDGFVLHALILQLAPAAALDLRHAVRYDLPGSNRQRFFGDLRTTQTLYIREPIPWHQVKISPFALDADFLPRRLLHEVVERETGHVVVLVPKRPDSAAVAAALNLALTKRRTHGWKIEQLL